MQSVQRVLRGADLESDTLFNLCGIDLQAVSPGTTRIISPKEVMHHVVKLDEHQQAKLIRLAARIEGMADPLGQQVLSDLSLNPTPNAYDNALHLVDYDEKIFRKAEEIRYVEFHRYQSRMWEGFYLIEPVPLDIGVDLTEFEQRLRDVFKQDKLVCRRQLRKRHNDDDEIVKVLQFIIYREGLPTSFEVLDEEGKDVVMETIHPAREYAVTYEPQTGVIELYADKKDVRVQLKTAFCESVLQQTEDPARIKLRKVNLELFRERPDFSSVFELRHGIQEVIVKEIELQIQPNKGINIVRATPRRSFRYDAYNSWLEKGATLPLDDRTFEIRSVTLSFRCEATEHLSEETIHVRLKGPNSCSLRDQSLRERYINHDLLVKMGVFLSEDRDET